MARLKGNLLLFISLFLAISLVTDTQVHAQSTVSGERISGSDRYQTSINISKMGWPVSSASGVAVIATGKDFPDALSAAPLAKKYNAPILLTDSDKLDPSLSSELTRLKVKKIFIIGGPGVVSQNIEDKLKKMGMECTRLFGVDRYETSTAVADEMGTVSRVIVATGEDFPDALSIAPWAASSGIPILLTNPTELPLSVESYIKRNNITSSYVIGGVGAVGNSVMFRLPNPTRIQGQDRFETNVAVLNEFNSEFDFNKMYIATGNDFPDALSGSALAALTKSPIILTDKGQLPKTKAYIDANIERINEAYVIGGEGAVSNSAVEGVIPPIVTGVEVTLPASSVAINKGVKAVANVTMIPSNAKKPPVTFTVGDNTIAKIEPDGTITGLRLGNTRVTASVGGKASSINLQVKMDKLIVIDPGHGGSSIGAVPTADDGVTKLLEYREAILNLQIAEKLKSRLESLGATVIMTRDADMNVSLEDRAKIANDVNADWFISIHHNSATNTAATGTSVYYSSYKPGANNGTIYVYASGTGPAYDSSGGVLGNVIPGNRYEYIDTFTGDNGENYVRFKFNGSTAVVETKADYITIRDDRITTVVQQSGDMARRISSSIASLGLLNRGYIENDFAVNRLTNMTSVLVEVGFISNTEEFKRLREYSFQEQIAEKISEALSDFYENSQNLPSKIPATL